MANIGATVFIKSYSQEEFKYMKLLLVYFFMSILNDLFYGIRSDLTLSNIYLDTESSGHFNILLISK